MSREVLQIAEECGAWLLGTEPADGAHGVLTFGPSELMCFARRMQMEALQVALDELGAIQDRGVGIPILRRMIEQLEGEMT